MQNKTYSSLLDLVEALMGVGSLTTAEQTNVLNLVNRRAFNAYQSSDAWPRYLIANEPRKISNQTCPYTQDGFHVFRAGTDAVNGLYNINGTQNSAAAYSLFDTDGTTELYSLIFQSGTTWALIAGAPDAGGETQYTNDDSGNTSTSSSPTIAETGWTAGAGTGPISVRDLADVAQFLRVFRSAPFINSSVIEYDFWTDFSGAHIENITTTTDTLAYFTYKKPFTDFTASSTDFPLEFFHYSAHGAYADMLRGDSQHDKALLEEAIAREFLDRELMKVDQTNNNSKIYRNTSTHITRQARN